VRPSAGCVASSHPAQLVPGRVLTTFPRAQSRSHTLTDLELRTPPVEGGGSDLEKARQIHLTAANAHNLDPPSALPVEDEIPAHREAADALGELRSQASHLRQASQDIAPASDPINQAIRGLGTALGHVSPDLDKVALGRTGESGPTAQERGLRRARRRRPSLLMAPAAFSSKRMCSPRSRARRPAPTSRRSCSSLAWRKRSRSSRRRSASRTTSLAEP